MSDLLSIGTTADVQSGGSSGSVRYGPDLDTGVLRRKYDFGDRVSELNIAQDPFFRFLNKLAKKKVNDAQWKFTERRPSWHKRYGYITAHGATSAVATTGDASLAAAGYTAGNVYYIKVGTDYKNSGNIQNIYGQSNGAIAVGASGTQPLFFLPGQVLKINYCLTSAFSATVPAGYMEYRVDEVDLTTSATHAILKCTVMTSASAAADLMWKSASAAVSTVYNKTIHSTLEPQRIGVIGTVHGKGTGYPETWNDQPFSTGQGQTQIWKTTMAMDNTDRATELKYERNEWARIWREKLIEHKWDVSNSLIFSSFSSTYRTTEGALSFITNYGNIFSLTLATKTQDSFLDDLSNFLDPRYNNGQSCVFYCQTQVYNWLHKLGEGSLFNNNLELINDGTNYFARANFDMSVKGRKRIFGIDVTVISTVYGDMNVVRDVHLDGTHVKILAIDMNHVKYRPLVGNGLNRDTSIYVGVQTLENSGVDRRVDLIQTEAGLEWDMPEKHAAWL
jgi:hypothetical protein